MDVLVRGVVDEVKPEDEGAVDNDAVDTGIVRKEAVGRGLVREDPAKVKSHSEGLLNEDPAVETVLSAPVGSAVDVRGCLHEEGEEE